MNERAMLMTMARISQEFCNILPRESVLFFAEGLRRRHREIPNDARLYLDALADVIQQIGTDEPEQQKCGPVLRIIDGGLT
jgi:hypothetical protein